MSHSDVPPHNNGMENQVGVSVGRRDISLHTMTPEGTEASDTLTSIVQTAKKLGVGAFGYIYDRVSEEYKLPSLADLIRKTHASTECYDTS